MDIPGTAPVTATPPETQSTGWDESKAAAPKQKGAPVKRGGRQAAAKQNGLSGKRALITLHDNDRIPPGGQFIGINGLSFMLLPGVEAEVPVELMNVLNDAVMTEPVLNERLQVDGHRNVPRLTYTFHRMVD